MGKSSEKRVEVPAAEDQFGEPQAGQNTEELTEPVILDEAGPPEAEAAVGAVPVLGDVDDVYVILPEGDSSNIPVVETQVLDDPSIALAGQEASDIATSETMSIEAAESGLFDDSIESRETQSLDQLTTEIDDQVLAESAGLSSDLLPVVEGSGEHALGEGPLLMDGGTAQLLQGPAKKTWVWKLVGVAALLAAAAGAMWYLGGFENEVNRLVAWISGSNSTAPPAVDPTGGEALGGSKDPTGTATVVPDSPGGEEDSFELKEAFRGRLLAAIELGFGGEVKHE